MTITQDELDTALDVIEQGIISVSWTVSRLTLRQGLTRRQTG